MGSVTRQYIAYWEWEDWLNGMWGKSLDESADLARAIAFTSDHLLYGSAMREVVEAWPRTMLNSLTNPSINRKAFLGHCAVTYKTGIPEYITRMAWKELTEEQRNAANDQAQQVITLWLTRYRTI